MSTLDAADATRVELLPVEALRSTFDFEQLYEAEYPALVAVAVALTGDTRDSEDLVQDTMVKALLHWRRVSLLRSPGGWCHHVLSNACRSWWRRRRTEARFLASSRHTDHFAGGPSPDVVAFWHAVRTLPTRPRMVVALHFAGERTMADIAAILRVPEGTVRSDVARAREFLIDALGLDR